jgi:hypothetical protein
MGFDLDVAYSPFTFTLTQVGSESTYGGSIMANSTREQQLPTTSNNTNNRLSNGKEHTV